MEGYSFSDGLMEAIQDGLDNATWKTVVVAFLAILCIATRIITGLQSSYGVKYTGESRPVRMAPYWFPWLGHGLSFAWDHASCIKKARLVPPMAFLSMNCLAV